MDNFFYRLIPKTTALNILKCYCQNTIHLNEATWKSALLIWILKLHTVIFKVNNLIFLNLYYCE